MNIEISGKNYKVSEKLRDLTEKKVSKLDKYFKEGAAAKVCFKSLAGGESAEITFSHNGLFIRGHGAGKDMFEGLDLALAKTERQIVKYKTKLQSKMKSDAFASKDRIYAEIGGKAEEPEAAPIAKVKTFDLLPMTPEEAVMNMELLSHDFFLFLNGATDCVEMVYLRADGTVGHIKTAKKDNAPTR